ncbi:MAG TPA: sulfatase-like hydrolase/transferase [Thermoleophilaceae bacterium]
MSIAVPPRARSTLALLATAAVVLTAAVRAPDAEARKPSAAPVVFLLFDEFPGDTLLDRPGHIDATRYPHFADLARHSTWFQNTQAVADMTVRAIPAILDARWPRKRYGHSYKTHPNSLFTLAAAHGYRLHVREVVTRMCPHRLCPVGPSRAHWQSRRGLRFAKFVRSLRDEPRTLWFEHTILPHSPRVYLPSGHYYPRGLPSTEGPSSFFNAFLTRQYQLRFALQLGYLDRLLGHMLARLRRTGLFDKALVVVTADHGLASDLGVFDRRLATQQNIDEMGAVPLFIKPPLQRRARVERPLARSIDLVPTIADLLRWRVGWRVNGRSLFDPAVRKRRWVRMPSRDFSHVIRLSLAEFNKRRAENVRHRVALLGSGHDSPFLIGPHPELVGRPLGEIPVDGFAPVTVRVRQDGFDNVDFASQKRPVDVVATVLGGTNSSARQVALAVNGVVAATGWSFHLFADPQEYLSVFMPEEALRPGANQIELFQVTPDGHLLRMREQPG